MANATVTEIYNIYMNLSIIILIKIYIVLFQYSRLQAMCVKQCLK